MTSSPVKQCNKCKCVKPVSCFHRCNTKSKDQYAYSCKECAYAHEKQNPNRAAIRKKSADKYREERNRKAREVSRQKKIAKYTERLTKDSAGLQAYEMYRAKRQSLKVAATPSWLSAVDRRKTTEIYATAALLQELTGSRYDVDHIVPLQSDVVCGLHVWWNLQPLPTSLNMQKRNIFEPSLYLDQGRVAFPDGDWTGQRAEHAVIETGNYDD
jgi:hypothetical protein